VDRALQSIDAWLGRLATLLGILAMVVMAIMAVHISASITSRWFLGSEIGGTLETTTYYYMVALTFLPLAFLARSHLHVRADVITQFYSPLWRAISEFCVEIAMAVFFVALTWRTLENAVERTRAGDAIATGSGLISVWPSRWLVPIGMAVAGLCALVMAFRLLTGEILPILKHSEPKSGGGNGRD
jgi:TRAP-type C4-dicarboxylate transport system permease small subunit